MSADIYKIVFLWSTTETQSQTLPQQPPHLAPSSIFRSEEHENISFPQVDRWNIIINLIYSGIKLQFTCDWASYFFIFSPFCEVYFVCVCLLLQFTFFVAVCSYCCLFLSIFEIKKDHLWTVLPTMPCFTRWKRMPKIREWHRMLTAELKIWLSIRLVVNNITKSNSLYAKCY